MTSDPIALARAVVARGHEGTEADTLARALLEERRRAEAAETALSRSAPRERDEFDALGFEP